MDGIQTVTEDFSYDTGDPFQVVYNYFSISLDNLNARLPKNAIKLKPTKSLSIAQGFFILKKYPFIRCHEYKDASGKIQVQLFMNYKLSA